MEIMENCLLEDDAWSTGRGPDTYLGLRRRGCPELRGGAAVDGIVRGGLRSFSWWRTGAALRRVAGCGSGGRGLGGELLGRRGRRRGLWWSWGGGGGSGPASPRSRRGSRCTILCAYWKLLCERWSVSVQRWEQ
jgi:hypothetical protein